MLGAFVESVNVYDNLTSNTWLDGEGAHLAERLLTEGEFKDSLTALLRLVVTGSGLSAVYDNPVSDGPAIALDKTASATISFTAVLQAPGAGQDIRYALNDPDNDPLTNPEAYIQIDSGAASGPLTLADGAAGNSLVIAVTSSSGDMAVYTVTVVKAYRLSYDGNGATDGAVPAGGLYYDGQEPVTVASGGSLVREGWSFVDWNTEADGTGDTYIEDQVITMGAAPLTLYARWIENGTVGVGFSLPEYRGLVFWYGGEAVHALTVSRDAGNYLVIGYGSFGGSDWAWYLDGIFDAEETSYSFDRSTIGRYVISWR